MKQKLQKFLQSLESDKIPAERKNTGYIMLAVTLTLFGLLAAGNALFDWELSMWDWICYLFIPLAAVSFIVTYGFCIWNFYPLVFCMVQSSPIWQWQS